MTTKSCCVSFASSSLTRCCTPFTLSLAPPSDWWFKVHVLGETRGSTLEVVVSRMKMRSTSLRFILVSATIPNIDDIAAWISTHGQGTAAKVLQVSPSGVRRSNRSPCIQFGEEYRPCQLARHVVGVKRHSDMNSFMFARSLNAQLFEVIQTYSAGKPILIFDSTRKGEYNHR
jgi:ATP-dependent DNA helicase HFM1/MER3